MQFVCKLKDDLLGNDLFLIFIVFYKMSLDI